jgi:hypothetical protein
MRAVVKGERNRSSAHFPGVMTNGYDYDYFFSLEKLW